MDSINFIATSLFVGLFFFGITWRRAIYFIPELSNSAFMNILKNCFIIFFIGTIIISYTKFWIVIAQGQIFLLNIPLLIITTLLLLLLLTVMHLPEASFGSGKKNPKHMEVKSRKPTKAIVYTICLVLLANTLLVPVLSV